jgi:hypothetical protein
MVHILYGFTVEGGMEGCFGGDEQKFRIRDFYEQDFRGSLYFLSCGGGIGKRTGG